MKFNMNKFLAPLALIVLLLISIVGNSQSRIDSLQVKLEKLGEKAPGLIKKLS
jgi:hypothetical protein